MLRCYSQHLYTSLLYRLFLNVLEVQLSHFFLTFIHFLRWIKDQKARNCGIDVRQDLIVPDRYETLDNLDDPVLK
jgi:hypothetical protein